MRKFAPHGGKLTILQIIGIILIFLGIVFVGIASIYYNKEIGNMGSMAAFGFFQLMLGMTFFFPDLLKGGENQISSMRVVIYMVVSVFVIITVKIGWGIKDLKNFDIPDSWVYILGIALGGKTIQSFSENLNKSKKPGKSPNVPLEKVFDPKKDIKEGNPPPFNTTS